MTESLTERLRRRARGLFTPARWSLVAPVSWFELGVVVLGTLALTAYAYVVSDSRPGPGAALGFYGWYDQREYLRLLLTLAGGHLPANASEYVYGLGYPLIGLPFKLVGIDSDPFLVPDLSMVAVAVAATYVLAVRVIGRNGGIPVVALLLFASPLVQLAIVPWSSTVTLVTLALALLIATAGPLTVPRAASLGFFAGAVFAARYVDVVAIIVVTVWCIVRQRKWTLAFCAAAPAAVVVGLVLLSQYLVLGSPFTTPYATHYRPDGTSDQSVAHYSIPAIFTHFIETFITAVVGDKQIAATPLVLLSPFLVLLPVGIVVILRRGDRWRSLHVATIAMSLAMSAVYLSFVAGGGTDLLYRNYRYWLPYYPYWTVLAVLAAVAGWRYIRRQIDASDVQAEPESPI